MKRSVQKMRLVWSVGAILLMASLVFGTFATSPSNVTTAGGGPDATQGYIYRGPSQDYAVVPHPWSLTYASPGSDCYVRDMDRHRRWEDEERKDSPPAVPERARTREITLASE